MTLKARLAATQTTQVHLADTIVEQGPAYDFGTGNNH